MQCNAAPLVALFYERKMMNRRNAAVVADSLATGVNLFLHVKGCRAIEGRPLFSSSASNFGCSSESE
jgi:hypothetical protein